MKNESRVAVFMYIKILKESKAEGTDGGKAPLYAKVPLQVLGAGTNEEFIEMIEDVRKGIASKLNIDERFIKIVPKAIYYAALGIVDHVINPKEKALVS